MEQNPSGSALAEGPEQSQNGQGQIDSGKAKDVQGLQEKLAQLGASYPNGLSYEPKSYSAHPDTHIDISTLIEGDAGRRERANFFLCSICAMVVKEPCECSGCQSLFCNGCIQPWAANNDSCPKKCQGNNAVQFKELHRYVKQDLLGLKFKCGLPECDFIGRYQEALDHKQTCAFQYQQCTQGCGLGVIGKDMEYHCMKQCKLFKVECETCEEASYPNDPERGGKGLEGHDCVQVLRANLKAAREEITMLKAAGGAAHFAGGHGNVMIACNDGCAMERTHGIPGAYDGHPRCDACGAAELHNFEFFYHCPRHQYDLCKVCAYKSANLLKVDVNGKFVIRGHGCPMTYEPNSDRHMSNGHCCDGAHMIGLNGRCQSSTNYNLSNKNQQYIYCDACNIDVCVCCAERLQY